MSPDLYRAGHYFDAMPAHDCAGTLSRSEKRKECAGQRGTCFHRGIKRISATVIPRIQRAREYGSITVVHDYDAFVAVDRGISLPAVMTKPFLNGHLPGRGFETPQRTAWIRWTGKVRAERNTVPICRQIPVATPSHCQRCRLGSF